VPAPWRGKQHAALGASAATVIFGAEVNAAMRRR
jgi:hypothetical protein